MMPVSFRFACCLATPLLALGVLAGDVWAQTRPRPARPFRGIFGGGQQTPDPNRTRTELTLTAGIQGGYDDNVAAGPGSGGGEPLPGAATSGYAGQANAALDFFHGKTSRSIRVVGSGTLSAYPEFIDGVVPGASLAMDGVTSLGRRNSLTVRQQLGYEPLFAFRGLSAVAGPPGPDAAALAPRGSALFERRSVTASTSASLDRRWSRHSSSMFLYSYSTQQYTDDEGGDARGHSARADFRRTLSSRASVQATYSYSNSEYADLAGVTRPILQHTLEGGPALTFRLSPRRSFSISASGGATHVESIRPVDLERYRYWAPYGSGTANLALSDTTSVSLSYRRGLTVLEGLTGQSFYTDSVGLTGSSLLTSRIDARIGGNFATGRTPSASGSLSDFRVYTASAEVRVALNRFTAATAAYNYYFHRYSNPAELPAGFPAEYDRHSVRVGLTLWVPLRGTYTGAAR